PAVGASRGAHLRCALPWVLPRGCDLVGLDGVGRHLDVTASSHRAREARLGRCRHAVPTRQAGSTLASRRCSQRGGAALGYRSGW
ncbi:MAG: hypothetical protein ACK56I_18735, partial [bacterium]